MKEKGEEKHLYKTTGTSCCTVIQRCTTVCVCVCVFAHISITDTYKTMDSCSLVMQMD